MCGLSLEPLLYLQIWFGELLEFIDDGSERSVDLSVNQLVLIAGEIFLKLSERSFCDWE